MYLHVILIEKRKDHSGVRSTKLSYSRLRFLYEINYSERILNESNSNLVCIDLSWYVILVYYTKFLSVTEDRILLLYSNLFLVDE